MPIRLKVGEHFTVYIPDDPKHLKEVMNIGFSDGFMREHFAGNKSRRLLQKKIRAA